MLADFVQMFIFERSGRKYLKIFEGFRLRRCKIQGVPASGRSISIDNIIKINQRSNAIMIMKTLKTILLASAVGLFAVAGARAADNPALTAPVKSVYGHYLKIQTSLARDSLGGVAENANAIAKAVQTDAKALPAAVATEAEALAKASDLRSARAAFKPLSDSLIQYLADHKAKDAYVQVYCPMAQASWLQEDKNVNNPYMGNAMSECGEIQN
jgi:uncharacterized protein DUF3347